MVKSETYLRKRAKRILYKLHKRGTSHLYDLVFGENKEAEKEMSRKILVRLIKKGLVTSDKVRLRGTVSEAYYWLTDEGEKVADEIAKEVDEYKSW